jgi:SAM-dependent methyltransferase
MRRVSALDEAARSGLALEHLPGNTAKLRLLLDLRALLPDDGRIRILDVGATGLYHPFELWEPLLPFADRIELVGVDVANLEPTADRAGELGFPFDLRLASALELTGEFGPERFDVVVSTQMLEHVPDWPRALREMRSVLKPGGRLLVTCDSGDLGRSALDRARLVAKRALARVGAREWERGPKGEALRGEAEALGLAVERLGWYGLRGLKVAQAGAGSETRLHWLAFEEALAEEAGVRPELYQLLYLRALR